MAAPHLLDAEVGQVLRRFVRSGQLTAERAALALSDLLDLGLERFPHGPLLGDAFQLRENVTFSDALYVVLAQALGCRVLTSDGRLRLAPDLGDLVVVR